MLITSLDFSSFTGRIAIGRLERGVLREGMPISLCKRDGVIIKSRINNLTLMVDLENEGQTHLCMTFLISGSKHDTNSILVSILTFSRSRISKMLKSNP